MAFSSWSLEKGVLTGMEPWASSLLAGEINCVATGTSATSALNAKMIGVVTSRESEAGIE
jgi:hypothetical protein